MTDFVTDRATGPDFVVLKPPAANPDLLAAALVTGVLALALAFVPAVSRAVSRLLRAWGGRYDPKVSPLPAVVLAVACPVVGFAAAGTNDAAAFSLVSAGLTGLIGLWCLHAHAVAPPKE